jgi:UPF0176 protein
VNVLNISCYRFVELSDPHAVREVLQEWAVTLELKGTILLAHEGINLFLAGGADPVRAFVAHLQRDARFAGIVPKESWSATQPFKKMLVKVKGEIIRMNHPTVRPAQGRAPAVDATTVKRWLDQGHDDSGRPVVTLDTRNDFEVDAGSFKGAIDWRLTKFSEFPQALRQHQADLHGKTVVSFCTGGIRCEKAAILMRELGLESVYQLEGGILKYFEEVGGAHYRGDCFVFDERRTLGADLRVTAPAAAAPALASPPG